MVKICDHCGQPYDVRCDCILNEAAVKFIYEKAQKGGEKDGNSTGCVDSAKR